MLQTGRRMTASAAPNTTAHAVDVSAWRDASPPISAMAGPSSVNTRPMSQSGRRYGAPAPSSRRCPIYPNAVPSAASARPIARDLAPGNIADIAGTTATANITLAGYTNAPLRRVQDTVAAAAPTMVRTALLTSISPLVSRTRATASTIRLATRLASNNAGANT